METEIYFLNQKQRPELNHRNVKSSVKGIKTTHNSK